MSKPGDSKHSCARNLNNQIYADEGTVRPKTANHENKIKSKNAYCRIKNSNFATFTYLYLLIHCTCTVYVRYCYKKVPHRYFESVKVPNNITIAIHPKKSGFRYFLEKFVLQA